MQLELFSEQGRTTVETEEWRIVAGFPRYECSSFGRFRNRFTGKYLCPTLVHNGYLHIGLMRNGRQITKLSHRIIAETFLEKPSPQHADVNHRDKVRTNNRVSNLEWSTRSNNSKHARSKIHLPLALGSQRASLTPSDNRVTCNALS